MTMATQHRQQETPASPQWTWSFLGTRDQILPLCLPPAVTDLTSFSLLLQNPSLASLLLLLCSQWVPAMAAQPEPSGWLQGSVLLEGHVASLLWIPGAGHSTSASAVWEFLSQTQHRIPPTTHQ